MGGGEYTKGWIVSDTTWVPPFRHDGTVDLVVNDVDWPGVEWPHYEGGWVDGEPAGVKAARERL